VIGPYEHRGAYRPEAWPEAFAREVYANLSELDGSVASSVSLLSGLSRDELDELGGFAGSGGDVE